MEHCCAVCLYVYRTHFTNRRGRVSMQSQRWRRQHRGSGVTPPRRIAGDTPSLSFLGPMALGLATHLTWVYEMGSRYLLTSLQLGEQVVG
jgi:hypothetical protein